MPLTLHLQRLANAIALPSNIEPKPLAQARREAARLVDDDPDVAVAVILKSLLATPRLESVDLVPGEWNGC